MALLSSSRERSLWLWALAILAAIYATMGLAQAFPVLLGEQGVLDAASFGLGMLLIAAAVIAYGLKLSTDIAIATGVAAVGVLAFARTLSAAERTHLFEYAVLAIFIHAALAERARNGRKVPVPPMLAILATAALGLLDEGIQRLLPGRVFDPFDILVNALAAVAGVGVAIAVMWLRTRGLPGGR